MGSFLNVAKPFEAWKSKAEETLYRQFPQMIDGGHYSAIHVGRNSDSDVGGRGGFRIRGNAATMRDALYFEAPDRMIDGSLISNHEAKQETFKTRASDTIVSLAVQQVRELMDKGVSKEEAQKRVNDSIHQIGFYDAKEGKFVVERIKRRVNDSILSGLTTPQWDIAVIKKVFRQPFLRGYADGLVNKIGIPNIWADLVQIYTETFEGMARVSNVAKTMGTANTSIAAKNRTGTMLSELINLVIDYESPQVQEMAIGGMPGNWLTNAAGVGSRDAYANLMLEQLMNLLYYFGHDESGFEGLMQIANRDGNVDQWSLTTASDLWDDEFSGIAQTAGADLLVLFSHFIADKMEDMNFLPTRCVVRCSPILYKVFKFSQLSRAFNQNNPLSVINTIYESENKLVGTMVTKSAGGVYSSFEIVPDPMLAAGTPFNPNTFDLTYIVFPELQSALEDGGLTDLVMAPVPIDKMILPSAPGYRDGVVRTAVKRIGSLLVPVEGCVHVIEGLGVNDFVPPIPGP